MIKSIGAFLVLVGLFIGSLLLGGASAAMLFKSCTIGYKTYGASEDPLSWGILVTDGNCSLGMQRSWLRIHLTPDPSPQCGEGRDAFLPFSALRGRGWGMRWSYHEHCMPSEQLPADKMMYFIKKCGTRF